MGGKRVVP
jgi:hypothetical protein